MEKVGLLQAKMPRKSDLYIYLTFLRLISGFKASPTSLLWQVHGAVRSFFIQFAIRASNVSLYGLVNLRLHDVCHRSYHDRGYVVV